MLNSIIEDVMPCGECPDYPTEEEKEYFYKGQDKVDWLKSLQPQPHWKPCEEQLKALKSACCYSSVLSETTIKNLYTLLDELKKL